MPLARSSFSFRNLAIRSRSSCTGLRKQPRRHEWQAQKEEEEEEEEEGESEKERGGMSSRAL